MIKKSILILTGIIFSYNLGFTQEYLKLVRTHDFEKQTTNAVILGDIDSDGDLDAVFSNMALNHTRVLLNDGKGNFTYTDQKLTQLGHGGELADLDGDKDLDLFITCAGWGNETQEYSKPSKIYFNDGKGNFTDSGQNLGDSLESGNGLNLIDIDSDGDLDCHIFYYNDNTYKHYHKIYLNDGKGFYTLSDIKFKEGQSISWGDLDGDKDVDAITRENGIGFTIFSNDGKGNFQKTWYYKNDRLGGGARGLADFDNDGDLDFIASSATRAENHPTIVFLNDGRGNLKKTDIKLPTVKRSQFYFTDFNNDNNIDIYIKGFKVPNYVWLGDGTGNFTDSGLSMCEKEGTGTCAFGDLDKDGDIDVFVAHYHSGSNSIWLNHMIE